MTVADPVVGVVRPVSTRNSVDLPAPFGPTTTQASPAPTSKVTSVSACTGWGTWERMRSRIPRPHGSYTLPSPVTSMTGARRSCRSTSDVANSVMRRLRNGPLTVPSQ